MASTLPGYPQGDQPDSGARGQVYHQRATPYYSLLHRVKLFGRGTVKRDFPVRESDNAVCRGIRQQFRSG